MSYGKGVARYPRVLLNYIRAEMQDPDPEYRVFIPDTNNILELHFSVRGPSPGPFAGGLYHGRILMDPDFPYKPPHVQLMTKSGRFDTFHNICFSYTAFHPETWAAAGCMKNLIIGLQSLFEAYDEHAVGLIFKPDLKKCKELAAESRSYYCEACKRSHKDILAEMDKAAEEKTAVEEAPS